MIAEGNGAQFRIAISANLAARIKALGTLAAQAGRTKEFHEALRIVERRLRSAPFDFGERVRDHPNSKLIEHVRMVGPLLVRFAIHTEKPLVFLLSVTWHI